MPRSYCPRGSDGLYCVRLMFFFIRTQNNSRTATFSSMKFYTNVYLDNRTNPTEFQGYRSNVKVTGPDFRIFTIARYGKKLAR